MFVIVAEHDSWGASKCVAIAESVGIPVTVYTTRPEQLSRVLSQDVPETKYLPFDGVAGVADDIVRRLGSEPPATAFAEKRASLYDRVREPIQRFATTSDRLYGRLSPRMRARVEAAKESASEVTSFTLAELFDLQQHAPDFVADVVQSVFGSSSTKARDHNDVDPFEARLDPDILRYFVAERDVTSDELISMLELAANTPRLVAGRLRADQNLRYLSGLLDRIRKP